MCSKMHSLCNKQYGAKVYYVVGTQTPFNVCASVCACILYVCLHLNLIEINGFGLRF